MDLNFRLPSFSGQVFVSAGSPTWEPIDEEAQEVFFESVTLVSCRIHLVRQVDDFMIEQLGS